MKILGNRISVRITKANKDSIYSKEITRIDGSKVQLFTAVPVDFASGEHQSRFVQTAIVEDVSDEVPDILKGDTALIDYNVCNMPERMLYKDGDDEIFWVEAKTTYHEFAQVEYASRKNRRDQIVFHAGDYDVMSSLLGILRGTELIANDPYVFLEHLPTSNLETTKSGIMYVKKDKILRRKVLAVSESSQTKMNIHAGDIALVDDYDIFNVKIDEKYSIDCINDIDILAKFTG